MIILVIPVALLILIILLDFIFPKIIGKKFRNLLRKEQFFWNLTVIRALFGIFGLCIGFHTLFFDTELQDDKLYKTNQKSRTAMEISIGFFLFECVALIYYDMIYSKRWTRELHVHHVASLIAVSNTYFSQNIHYFSTLALLLEMTTPFTAFSWCTLKMGYSQRTFWKINQFFLLHLFHLRHVIECYALYAIYQLIADENKYFDIPFFVAFWNLFGYLLLAFYLTPFWTYKKTMQIISPHDFNHHQVNKKM
ncbi:hypothetical protein SNEBB_009180 [Seison nebaliae]|nr:hypothetical protein SNEBB_009180 [Seison nebaliae]